MDSITFVFALLIVMTGAMTLSAQTGDDAAETIIAMEKAALERWGNGDPWGFIEICAPEVTYQDPSLKLRIEGLETLTAYYKQAEGKISLDGFELLNPRVQQHGDVAVLTFNYVSWSGTGDARTESRWNCTEVYRRGDEGWRIIHTHWSYTQPKLSQDD